MTQSLTLEAVRANHIGFGWYMRRCPDSSALSEFYGGTIRLPLIRGNAPVWFYWGGEANIFELKSDVAPKPERESDPASASCVPVFRAHRLGEWLEDLRRSGVRVAAGEAGAGSREAFLVDPDGQLIGFRERGRDSVAAGDRDAWRRFDRGENFNPGCSPMPAHLQDLGWIVRRVSDLAAATAFYDATLGFSLIERKASRSSFDIGNGVILELTPGGRRRPVPSTREEVTNTWVHRVANHDSMNAWLKSQGAILVNDKIQFNSAELTYVADPDGNIVGFEERYEPARFRMPRRPFLEDLEADRRYFGPNGRRSAP